jgi:hypothetical protein
VKMSVRVRNRQRSNWRNRIGRLIETRSANRQRSRTASRILGESTEGTQMRPARTPPGRRS